MPFPSIQRTLVAVTAGIILSACGQRLGVPQATNSTTPFTNTNTGFVKVVPTRTDKINFGALSIPGTTPATQTIQLYSAGTLPPQGVTFQVSGDGFSESSSDCATKLTSTFSCSIVIAFQPTMARTYSGTFTVTNPNLDPIVIELEGSGVNAPTANLVVENAAAVSDFGSTLVGLVTDRVLFIRNMGSAPATSLAVVAPTEPGTNQPSTIIVVPLGSQPNDPAAPNCIGLTTLPANSRCAILVRFVASAAAGTLVPVRTSATLTMNYADFAARKVDHPLSGNSLAAPVLQVASGIGNTFSRLRINTDVREGCLTVLNPHTVLNARYVSAVTGGGPFSVPTGVTCGNAICAANQTLAPNARCDVPVRFAPTAGGTHNTVANITYFNGLQNQTASQPVQGTAINRCTVPDTLVVITSSANFPAGTRQTGSTKTTLPADSQNISFQAYRYGVDDYAPYIQVNNQVVIDNSAEAAKNAYDSFISPPTPLSVVPGENIIRGGVTNRSAGPSSVTVYWRGTYETISTCAPLTFVPGP